MKTYNYLRSALVLGTLVSSHLRADYLTEQEMERAKTLATSLVKFENYTRPEEANEKPIHWLTFETFNFEYKGNNQTFYVANSVDTDGHWGNLALYPLDADLTKLNLSSPGSFNDMRGARYLSELSYEFIPGDRPHFILEKVQTSGEYKGCGYSQALTKYFVDEFVSKRTDITYVFSDCRNGACKAYFPKYGFKQGKLEGYTFIRAMHAPYYWAKEDEKK